MNEELRKYITQWLTKSDEDLEVAQRLISENPDTVLSAIGFHCQQSIEKNLKAFLIFSNSSPVRTHDLNLLRDLCSENDNTFSDLDFGNLNDFAVDLRYPDDFYIPDLEEAQSFIDLSKQVRILVLSRIIF